MGNERLRGQLTVAGLTATDLASAVEVDPKTVERWISDGRIPHSRHRSKAAEALAVDEGYLWPALLEDARTRETSQAEVVAVYPNRGAVPHGLWRRLVEGAQDQANVLVYAGLFLIDSIRFARATRRTRRSWIVATVVWRPGVTWWRGEAGKRESADNLAARSA